MDIRKVSKLGFGTSQIGGPSLISGKLVGPKPIPKKTAIGILRYAYESGINFFDTSDKYGNAEELLGEVFCRARGNVVIATKCGLTENQGRDFSAAYVNTCLENSLRRLKADYIDIFQLTKPDVSQVGDELLMFLGKKIREGKIRHFGISVIGNDDGQAYLPKKIIQSLQIFHNLLFSESCELINKCAKNNKFVIIRSPLNSGILSGKYTKDTKFDKFDPRNKIFRNTLLRERLECIEKIKTHFNLSSDMVLAFSLNFIFSNDNVNVVIPAASKITQLKRYINIFNEDKRFTKTESKEILNFLRRCICLKHEGQCKIAQP